MLARRDHPRACGAHAVVDGHQADDKGSSPRMRGSLCERRRNDTARGIIPAHAGLTLFREFLELVAGDHPRACGAHRHKTTSSYRQWGSSPRMRGSRSAVLCCALFAGIIPAHAGLTDATAHVSARGRDHPRACGAHSGDITVKIRTWGSSPRMRGSRGAARHTSGSQGIIPAHAGLTAF